MRASIKFWGNGYGNGTQNHTKLLRTTQKHPPSSGLVQWSLVSGQVSNIPVSANRPLVTNTILDLKEHDDKTFQMSLFLVHDISDHGS